MYVHGQLHWSQDVIGKTQHSLPPISLALIAQSALSLPSDPTTPPWVVDPAEPGTNLPPIGRSLFDFLITKSVNGKKVYDIPFPFSALVAHLESHLHSKRAQPALKQLLIPVNRSLQRRAGNGEYFTYPRAVLAVDTEADLSLVRRASISKIGSSSATTKSRLFWRSLAITRQPAGSSFKL